jgi:hypothetical protein
MWPMSVAMSIDQGRMWTVVRDLEEDFDPFLEYSSPSVVQSVPSHLLLQPAGSSQALWLTTSTRARPHQ